MDLFIFGVIFLRVILIRFIFFADLFFLRKIEIVE